MGMLIDNRRQTALSYSRTLRSQDDCCRLSLHHENVQASGNLSNWITANLPVSVDVGKLSDDRYYDAALDYIHLFCKEADMLPCIFDAAAFEYEEKGVRGYRK
jgi:hypothetical protein